MYSNTKARNLIYNELRVLRRPVVPAVVTATEIQVKITEYGTKAIRYKVREVLVRAMQDKSYLDVHHNKDH